MGIRYLMKHQRQQKEYERMLYRRDQYSNKLKQHMLKAAERYAEAKRNGIPVENLTNLIQQKNGKTSYLVHLKKLIQRNSP